VLFKGEITSASQLAPLTNPQLYQLSGYKGFKVPMSDTYWFKNAPVGGHLLQGVSYAVIAVGLIQLLEIYLEQIAI